MTALPPALARAVCAVQISPDERVQIPVLTDLDVNRCAPRKAAKEADGGWVPAQLAWRLGCAASQLHGSQGRRSQAMARRLPTGMLPGVGPPACRRGNRAPVARPRPPVKRKVEKTWDEGEAAAPGAPLVSLAVALPGALSLPAAPLLTVHLRVLPAACSACVLKLAC